MTQYLLFEAGGLHLAAQADLVKAIHEDLSIEPVVGTCRWFRGLAVAHGKLLPVTDVGAFAGRRSSGGRTLELDPSAGIAGLQVDTVHGLCEATIQNVPVRNSGDQHKGADNLALTTRAIVQDERVHRLIDLAAIVQSAAFLSIANQ